MAQSRSSDVAAAEPPSTHVSFYVSVVDAERAREVLGQITDSIGEEDTYAMRWADDGESEPVFCTNEPVADQVTEAQLHTARLAVDRGYYERPRRVDLEEIADELDVSPSAVSRRLSEVERKLVTALVEYRG